MCGPRRLRMRMWIGFWPPSKRARRLAPDRDPHPFWPRPAVLPVPEPSPRPTRLRGRRDPGVGFRLCRPIRSCSAIGGDLDQMPYAADHAADLRGVVVVHLVAYAAQAQRSQRLPLLLVGAVARSPLGDLERAHELVSSAPSTGRVPDRSASWSELDSPAPSSPRTWLTDSPRSSATSSGVRSDSSPAIVALTRLMGFWEPRLLERMSWIPASSSTARTPPPAMTPVPGAAGLRNTRPAPKMPVVECVIVLPCLGTR